MNVTGASTSNCSMTYLKKPTTYRNPFSLQIDKLILSLILISFSPFLFKSNKNHEKSTHEKTQTSNSQIFKELMEKFNQLLHGIYYLRDFIPLNLFMLDNRIVNRVLEKLVRELKNFVTNYFVTLNQVENRRMCDEFEEMSITSGERPSDTPEVVALQNYLVVCREDKLFRLKSMLLHYIMADKVLYHRPHDMYT